MRPIGVFFAKSVDKEKKYAFLKLKDEAERNLALGSLEEIKKSGVFGSEVSISPAYPSFHMGRKNKFNSSKRKTTQANNDAMN